MTFDEKEAKLVELFNELKEKEIEEKDLKEHLKKLYQLKELLTIRFEENKNNGRVILDTLIGKGKDAETILAPSRLRNEERNLQNKSVNPYNGIVNEAALKEYEAKKQVLKEDIELADIDANLTELQIENYEKEYPKLKEQKKENNAEIRKTNKMLRVISKDIKRFEKQIKATDKIVVEEELGRTK